MLGLAVTELRTPRALATDRARVAMRVLVVAREQMTGERTRAVNALTALLRTIDIGVDARKPLTAGQIAAIAAWRERDEDATTATCRHEATRLAQRIRALGSDLADNRADITELIAHDTPQLLDLTGVGAVVAASILIAWSHPGRVRSDAAMASLAGTCPIPASSGNTVRHRLNRGGDRRLNRAVTTIAIVRMRMDPPTPVDVDNRSRSPVPAALKDDDPIRDSDGQGRIGAAMEEVQTFAVVDRLGDPAVADDEDETLASHLRAGAYEQTWTRFS